MASLTQYNYTASIESYKTPYITFFFYRLYNKIQEILNKCKKKYLYSKISKYYIFSRCLWYQVFEGAKIERGTPPCASIQSYSNVILEFSTHLYLL